MEGAKDSSPSELLALVQTLALFRFFGNQQMVDDLFSLFVSQTESLSMSIHARLMFVFSFYAVDSTKADTVVRAFESKLDRRLSQGSFGLDGEVVALVDFYLSSLRLSLACETLRSKLEHLVVSKISRCFAQLSCFFRVFIAWHVALLAPDRFPVFEQPVRSLIDQARHEHAFSFFELYLLNDLACFLNDPSLPLHTPSLFQKHLKDYELYLLSFRTVDTSEVESELEKYHRVFAKRAGESMESNRVVSFQDSLACYVHFWLKQSKLILLVENDVDSFCSGRPLLLTAKRYFLTQLGFNVQVIGVSDLLGFQLQADPLTQQELDEYRSGLVDDLLQPDPVDDHSD